METRLTGRVNARKREHCGCGGRVETMRCDGSHTPDNLSGFHQDANHQSARAEGP
jgi:hypothetical protein